MHLLSTVLNNAVGHVAQTLVASFEANVKQLLELFVATQTWVLFAVSLTK